MEEWFGMVFEMPNAMMTRTARKNTHLPYLHMVFVTISLKSIIKRYQELVLACLCPDTLLMFPKGYGGIRGHTVD